MHWYAKRRLSMSSGHRLHVPPVARLPSISAVSGRAAMSSCVALACGTANQLFLPWQLSVNLVEQTFLHESFVSCAFGSGAWRSCC